MVAALGVGVATLASVPQAAQATAAPAGPLMTDSISAPGLTTTAVGESANPDGTFTGRWTVSGIPVSVTGPKGMTANVTTTHTARGMQIALSSTPPPKPKPTGNTVRPLFAGQIWQSWCQDLGNPAWSYYQHACEVKTITYQSGNDWYMSDNMSTSSFDHNGWLGAATENAYIGGNTVVEWNPGGPVDTPTNCQQKTVGITFYGVNVSNTFTECPDWMGVWVIYGGTYGTQMGQNNFTNNSAYHYMAGVDLVHSPPGYYPESTLHTYIWGR